jgi:hypothetical protein
VALLTVDSSSRGVASSPARSCTLKDGEGRSNVAVSAAANRSGRDKAVVG